MVYAWPVFLFVLPLCWLAGFAVGRAPRGPGPSHRRPGYIRPSLNASVSASRTTAATRTLEATSTGCKTGGRLRAVPDVPATRREPSRTIAPIVSGDDTASVRGDHTTDAELRGFSTPLASYVWPDGVTRFYPDDAA